MVNDCANSRKEIRHHKKTEEKAITISDFDKLLSQYQTIQTSANKKAVHVPMTAP
jgi:hypothetical protein